MVVGYFDGSLCWVSYEIIMKKFLIIFLTLVALLALSLLIVRKLPPAEKSLEIGKTMIITSSAFVDGENIPDQYGCKGQNINPPLDIKDVPTNAKSLVLIVDDPDSPTGNWVHWLVWNIDPTTLALTAGQVPFGVSQGKNSFGDNKYGGPCPGSGTHHYHFKIYALDTLLGLPDGSTKEQLLNDMASHILAQGLLIGTYSH